MNLTLLTTSNTSNDLAVIYTKLPLNSDKNYKAHLKDCKDVINYNHFKIFKIYNDDSITENESLYCRPEFSELINDAKEGKFTTIIVPSIDRLTRTYKEYLNLKSLLKELNLRLIVANIPF